MPPLQSSPSRNRVEPATHRMAAVAATVTCAWPILTILTILAVLAGAAPVTAAAQTAPAAPVRLESRAFGQPLVVEVIGEDETAARDAARATVERLVELDHHLAEATERLNGSEDATGGDPPEQADAQADARADTHEREVVVDRETADLLSRTRQFCEWSGGAHGPLGGALEEHWRAVGANPTPPPVPAAATESATCNNLAVDPEAKGPWVRVRIATGSRLDLAGFATGFAIDRAIDLLRDRGIDNARVRVGRIVRAIGDGPGGTGRPGWPTRLPTFEGYTRPLEELTLHDQSLAVIWRADWPADHPLFVDQRTGEPPAAGWATVVVTELAVDAQALGVSALVLGGREGRFRIAGLKPVPSVLWLQGTGKGRPLIMELNWTALRNP